MLPASGIVDCGKQVVKEEGVRALWKGLTPFATHLTLKYALRMGSNSAYQVGRDCTRGGPGANACASSSSSSSSSSRAWVVTHSPTLAQETLQQKLASKAARQAQQCSS